MTAARALLDATLLLAALQLATATCSGSTDVDCMNARALMYTNKIRRAAGKGPLAMGSKAMLDNAVKWNRVLARRGSLFHQPIGQGIYVGSGDCRAMLTGENLAQNFIRGDATDAAQLCCEQWRKSPGHYANLVADNLNAVVGIWVAPDRKIWCTQVFSKTPPTSGGQCAAAGSDAPLPPPADEEEDKGGDDEHALTRGEVEDEGLIKVCNAGRCKYCTPDGEECWWE